jgi:CubicO group peptidase (beta-lactamase class C family)
MLRALCIPLFLLLAGCGSEDPFDAPELPSDVGVAGDGTLPEVLEPIRAAWDVPALGAIMIVEGQVLETAAVGRRSLSSSDRVTAEDLWHVGDLTKSMTATLAGVLVEDGLLDWTTTVAQAMPDVAAVIRVEYQDVRLEELLSHTSGLGNDLTGTTWWSQLPHSDPLPDQRVALATELMQNQAGAPRGEFLYSNGGYVVAGAMIERVTGEQWEDLVVEHVFNPLGMFTASFGAPGRAGSFLQPWGHALENGNYSPVEPGPDADSPEVVGPAGTVHMSMADFARYAAAHIAGERGVDGLVTAETFARLHQQTPGTASGLGWLLAVRVWANGIALHHEGSNQLWYANTWLSANRDFGVLVVTNAGGNRAFDATEATVDALVERFEAAQAP